MTPGRTPASGFYYSDSCAGEGGSCMGDSDPFWGCDAEGENASVSTCRWGGVSVVQPAALESPLSLYSPGHDSTPLSPTSLFSALPNSGAWAALPSADIGQLSGSETGAALPSADIGQLSGSETGAALPPGDIHQLSVNKSAASPEPPQWLTRKRVREVEQTEAAPSAKKSADRMVQIADFTWTLPPDPGKDGPYPSLIFLVGAAISSSNSGMMTPIGIRQWIRVRYPSRGQSPGKNYSINRTLKRRADFIYIRCKRTGMEGWKLRDPEQFRRYYEKSIFLKRRCGIGSRDIALRNPLPAPGQGSPWATSPVPGSLLSGQSACSGTESEVQIAPALSVKIGGSILTLPPYSAGQQKPPLRLLCGCAIAFGSKQGANVKEIIEWIAGRYFVVEVDAIEVLDRDIRATLGSCGGGFRRIKSTASGRHKGRRIGRWVLENPADFAASYGGRICSQDS